MKLIIALIILIIPSLTEARFLKPLPQENDKATTPLYATVAITPVSNVKPGTWDIHGLINYYSKLRWLDPALIHRIVKCESGYHAWAKSSSSSAMWLFQFINGTRNSSSKRYGRAGHERFEIEASIAVGTQKIKVEWTSARNASKKCRAR